MMSIDHCSFLAMKNMFSVPGISEETGNKINDLLGDLSTSIPGIDEAVSFSELMKQVENMKYETVVFDTAPTGHTLRLLSFPGMLESSLEKIDGLSNSFGGILNQITSLIGNSGVSIDDLKKKLSDMKESIHKVSLRFKNADETTFVCVCIPEFLSVYETERLVQQLTKYGISVNSVVINQVCSLGIGVIGQVVFPDKECTCRKCIARRKMQDKYINQIFDLFQDFHIVMIPQLIDEVRGADSLREFSNMFIEEYNPEEHGEMLEVEQGKQSQDVFHCLLEEGKEEE